MLLVRTRRLMLQDVDEFSQRVSNIEPADAPRLTDGTVLDRNAGSFNPAESLGKIIHFYRKVRNWRIRSALASETDLHSHL